MKFITLALAPWIQPLAHTRPAHHAQVQQVNVLHLAFLVTVPTAQRTIQSHVQKPHSTACPCAADECIVLQHSWLDRKGNKDTGKYQSLHWCSRWMYTLGPFIYFVMNNIAFRNLFCNPQKSFHASPTRIIEAVNSRVQTIAGKKITHRR